MKTKPTVSDNPGEKMTLYGIAEKVLREREGQGLRSGEIADAARKQGLIDNARGNVAQKVGFRHGFERIGENTRDAG